MNCSALDLSTCTSLLTVAEAEVSLADISAPVEDRTSSSSSSSLAEVRISPQESIYPEAVDLIAAQARAKVRYEERLEIARWKYEWELVSAQMTHTVIKRQVNQQ
jgi:hypothetical protein